MIRLSFRKSIHALFCVIAFACVAEGDEFARPRSSKDLPNFTTEDAVRVNGAEIGWADYYKLRRDFPALNKLSEADINRWLIDNFAFVGVHQSKLIGIRNTHIPIDPHETKKAFRPEEWKRSAMMDAYAPNSKRVIGMVDAKGFGHGAQTENEVNTQIIKFNKASNAEDFDKMHVEDHNDGLMSAGEGIAEVTRQRAKQTLFELQYLPLETVESYATILYPFEILKQNGQKIRAALHLRQANVGRREYYEAPDTIYTDPRGHKQRTASNTAVDEGGVLIQDARLKGNFGSDGDVYNPQASRPWVWGHDTASAYERGDKAAIARHLREMLAPLDVDLGKESNKLARAERNQFQADMRKKYFSLRKISYQKRLEELTTYKFDHPHFKKAWANAVNDVDAQDFVSKTLQENEGTLEMISEALHSSLPNSRSSAVFSLARDHGDAAIPMLQEVLDWKRESRLREMAAYGLSSRPNTPSRLVEKMLDDPLADVRNQAAPHLARADLSFEYWKKAFQEGHGTLHDSAIMAMKNRNDIPTEWIATLMSGKDEKAKTWALAALRGRHDEAAMKILEQATHDANESIRASAIEVAEAERAKVNANCRSGLNLIRAIIP